MFADLHTFIFEHSITSGRHFTDDMAKTVASSLIHTRNNNNNNNKHDNVYGAVIMAEPLREFTRFI